MIRRIFPNDLPVIDKINLRACSRSSIPSRASDGAVFAPETGPHRYGRGSEKPGAARMAAI